jgi:hypothetical protein
MREHLKERLLRKLEGLPEERVYQVLDYVEFLESKYAERSNPDNVFTRITEKVEDTLRAGKVPLDAVAGTVNLFDGASKVMRGLSQAAQAVVDEAAKTAKDMARRPEQSRQDAVEQPTDNTTPPNSEGSTA